MSRRVDPTGTATIQREYASAMRGAIGRVNSDARERIVGGDALELKGDGDGARLSVGPFVDWLRERLRSAGSDIHTRRSNEYLRSGYNRGLKDADSALRSAGWDVDDLGDPDDVLRTPPHSKNLRGLFSEAAREWRGVVNAVAQAAGRELAEAVRRGESASAAARSVSDRMQHVGKYRATKLAQNEVVKAHADATLARFEQAGVSEVGAQVEYQTAEDNNVCEKCRGLNGETYALAEARGVIPVHPACRCRWYPARTQAEATAAAGG